MTVVADIARPVPGTDRWAPALYFVVGQVGWFACVLSAARGAPWIGVGITVVFIVTHVVRAGRPVAELKLIAAVAAIGGIWESALVYLGLLSYPSGMVADGWTPYWLPALWALFAAQINITYAWMKTRLAAAALLGAVAGPLSFRAGAGLHALRFEKSWLSVAALAVGWAVILPSIIVLSRRWDGVTHAAPSPAIVPVESI